MGLPRQSEVVENLDLDSIESIVGSASDHVTLALAILGGTLLTVVGTSHVSPKCRWGRSIYLLFLPSWAFLALSIYFGDLIQRSAISLLLVDESLHEEIKSNINSHYGCQLSSLMWAGGFLVVWLVLYVVWWIYFREVEEADIAS